MRCPARHASSDGNHHAPCLRECGARRFVWRSVRGALAQGATVRCPASPVALRLAIIAHQCACLACTLCITRGALRLHAGNCELSAQYGCARSRLRLDLPGAGDGRHNGATCACGEPTWLHACMNNGTATNGGCGGCAGNLLFQCIRPPGCACWQAPGFQEQVADLLALVLASMAGPEAQPSTAGASMPARAQVRAAAARNLSHCRLECE